MSATITARDITDRAMLATLSITQWTAKKHDKRASAEVAENHNSDVTMGRYNKALIPQDALAEIVSAQGDARTYHYSRTLPWLDSGARILPSGLFTPYNDAMRTFRYRFEKTVAAFMLRYDGLIQESRVRLNGLFVESEYPTPDEIARKFTFEVQIMPVPQAGDFRVSLDPADAARIQQDIQTRTDGAVADAVTALWAKIHEPIARMVDRLTHYAVTEDGKTLNPFRDSLVTNIRDLVELLPALNITNDPAMAAIAADMAAQLCRYDAPSLREDETLRQDVARDAQAILDRMAGYVS